jgi:hypothetical protein
MLACVVAGMEFRYPVFCKVLILNLYLKLRLLYVRFNVLMVTNMRIAVFWDPAACSLVNIA